MGRYQPQRQSIRSLLRYESNLQRTFDGTVVQFERLQRIRERAARGTDA